MWLRLKLPRIRTIYWVLLLPVLAAAQSAISARYGFIQYVDGHVFLIPSTLQSSASIGHLTLGQGLRTERGRAEVQVTNGVLLRIADETEFEMLPAGPNEIRIEVHHGSAAIDVASAGKIASVSASCHGILIRFRRSGEYRLDCGSEVPARLRVFRGAALVEQAGVIHAVRAKLSADWSTLTGEVALTGFNPTQTDYFDAWIRDRRQRLTHNRRQPTVQEENDLELRRQLPCSETNEHCVVLR